MKRTIVIVAALALGLAACGSDDGGSGGSDLSDAQSAAAQSAIEEASAGGLELEESCVNDVASQLTEEDAEAIAASAPGESAELSPEGEALGLELLSCANEDALVDLFIAGMGESGEAFDEGCAREKLADFDVADLVAASQGGDPPADLIGALVECMGG